MHRVWGCELFSTQAPLHPSHPHHLALEGHSDTAGLATANPMRPIPAPGQQAATGSLHLGRQEHRPHLLLLQARRGHHRLQLRGSQLHAVGTTDTLASNPKHSSIGSAESSEDHWLLRWRELVAPTDRESQWVIEQKVQRRVDAELARRGRTGCDHCTSPAGEEHPAVRPVDTLGNPELLRELAELIDLELRDILVDATNDLHRRTRQTMT